MAMIKCPECGKEISDKATTCPNCGAPIGTTSQGAPAQPDFGQYNGPAQQPPKKKKKHRGLVVLAVIVVLMIIIIAVANSGGNSNSDTKTADSQTSDTTVQTDTTAEADASTDVNAAATDAETDSEAANEDYVKYQQISMGQSLQDVEGILGTSETVSSSSEIAGTKSEIYSWSVGVASSVTVTFTNGAVSGKGQIGITAPDAVTIDRDKFNAINTGMTYDEVVAVVGGPGTEDSYTEFMGSTSTSYIWSGSSLGSSASVTFTDGKVSNKTQFGL